MTQLIGVTGKIGSGKDAVFQRLDYLYPDTFVRFSFAAKLKEATAALLNVPVEKLEEWKRDSNYGVQLVHADRGGLDFPMSIRTVLQVMGTEVGRNIFGKDFWVQQAMYDVDDFLATWYEVEFPEGTVARREQDQIAVMTDVRFENEALAIKDRGGEIWQVIGPDQDTGSHASEAGISASLIDRTIDNRERGDGFDLLDSKLKQIVDTWSYVS